MALPFFNWSRTAASNATADSTVNWAEGQAPSTVNDSARAMMASTAAYRDDVAAAITTGGTATAYTLTTFQVFDSLAHLNGQIVGFVPHATNTNAVGVDVTLNVDGLGAKSIRMQPSVALPNGTLVLGTPYIAVYNSSDAVFYLRNMVNPYNIPLAAGMDFWGTTAPNSSFVFAFGQAISRTTYATLFSIFSTTYGVGDGSSTFNIPDLRGRVAAGIDNMGGSAAGLLSGVTFASGNSTTAGSKLGIVTQTIGQANLPNISPTFTGSSGTVSINSTRSDIGIAIGNVLLSGGGSPVGAVASGGVTVTSQGPFTPAGTISSINGGVTQSALPTIQPTIICNYIIRII